MGGDSGARARHCPFCDDWYHRTNWMVRRGYLARRQGEDGMMSLMARDTHQIACAKRLGWSVEQVR
jgi:hypothetical protein